MNWKPILSLNTQLPSYLPSKLFPGRLTPWAGSHSSIYSEKLYRITKHTKRSPASKNLEFHKTYKQKIQEWKRIPQVWAVLLWFLVPAWVLCQRCWQVSQPQLRCEVDRSGAHSPVFPLASLPFRWNKIKMIRKILKMA
jgi:hypothetical protein